MKSLTEFKEELLANEEVREAYEKDPLAKAFYEKAHNIIERVESSPPDFEETVDDIMRRTSKSRAVLSGFDVVSDEV